MSFKFQATHYVHKLMQNIVAVSAQHSVRFHFWYKAAHATPASTHLKDIGSCIGHLLQCLLVDVSNGVTALKGEQGG